MASLIKFGAFELDLRARELRKHGLKIGLPEQSIQVLAMLLERPGEVALRQDIQKKLWPNDTIVEFDHSINAAVKRLRRALGDEAEEPRYVETLPRRGYRFIYPMEVGEGLLPAQERPRGAPLRRWAWLATLLAVIVAGIVVGWLLLRRQLPQPPHELTQTRLTFNSSENSVSNDAISPDGKYLAYSTSAGIHVKLLSTGEDRLIPKPSGDASAAWWGLDSWFPDGTQLLFDMDGPGAQYSVWTVSALGQAPRELRGGAGGWGISPDGTRIAFSPGSSNHFRELWVMGSQGDNPQKVLAVGENDVLQNVHWSPDGKRLAYTTKPRASLDWFKTNIETSDLAGANRTIVVSLVSSWMDDFCWLSDGRIVYSLADHPGIFDVNLWQVGVDGHSGKPTSQPKRITRWAESIIGFLSASVDGKRLAFLKRAYQSQVYLAELPTEGRKMGAPRQITNDEHPHRATAWTEDSQAVLFASEGGIFKQRITQETAEPVVSDPAAWVPRLSADGAWVLYMMGDLNREGRLMRVPVGGGIPQIVMETRPWWDFNCASAPSSLCVILEVSPDENHLAVTAFDPLKGRGKVLRTVDRDPSARTYVAALSPDGSTLALSKDREPEMHIRLLSLSGSPDREITVKGWQNISWNGLYWAPHGTGLYCGSVLNQRGAILYVGLNGNSDVVWQFKGTGGPVWGVPSPDGRYLAMENHPINSNAWMLEGF